MELPCKPPGFPGQETRFMIKTKKVSYKLSRRDCFGWFPRRKSPANTDILRNVDCEARPGEITAIAGQSGAGKTTLLEILAGVIPPSRVYGHVLVNDQPMDAAKFRRVSGFVTQQDALFPLLTVEETLMYSARLRLHDGPNRAVIRVKELLKELGLEHVASSRVGGETHHGISGGERRRVSIGVDLVHDPPAILLDEPTSGLDSTSAFHVASLLKSMATKLGKTIILSIHQPSFRIIEQFDRIVLLSKGTVLHHGPLNLLEQRLSFSGHSIPRHVNVLEFAIEMTEALIIDTEETETEDSDADYRCEDPIRHHSTKLYLDSFLENEISYPNSRIAEIRILGNRFFSNIYRTKELFVARIMQSLLAGIVLGTIFMNACNDPNKLNLQTQIGFFAFSLTFLLSSTTEGLPIYLQERKILMRETTRGAYRVSSYVISNTLVFLPFLLVVALLYAVPVYWLVGLRREIDKFFYFALGVWMVVLMSNSFVACLSALVPSFIMGTSLIAGIIGSFFLFSGYFISKNDIPKFWIFMHYLSLFKYPFECFLINEYGGNHDGKCLQNVEGQCVLYGNEFLLHQGLKESQKWSNMGVLLGFIVGYRVVCFLILCYRSCSARG